MLRLAQCLFAPASAFLPSRFALRRAGAFAGLIWFGPQFFYRYRAVGFRTAVGSASCDLRTEARPQRRKPIPEIPASAPCPGLVAKQQWERHMRSEPNLASPSRFPRRKRFVLVNDRLPRNDANCALCSTKIESGYVREPQTNLVYCDPQCFAGHETMAMQTLQHKARRSL